MLVSVDSMLVSIYERRQPLAVLLDARARLLRRAPGRGGTRAWVRPGRAPAVTPRCPSPCLEWRSRAGDGWL